MKLEYKKIAPGQGHAAGRELLRSLYFSHTGKPLEQICISEKGKPYFADGLVHFSISHTKLHAFCVISSRPIGIDAEEADRQIDLRLAEKILSKEEKAQFDRAQDKQRALLTFWVLKEALAKCEGTGLQGYPNKTSFSLDDPRVQYIDGCIVAIIEN